MDPKVKIDLSLDELINLDKTQNAKRPHAIYKNSNSMRPMRKIYQNQYTNQTTSYTSHPPIRSAADSRQYNDPYNYSNSSPAYDNYHSRTFYSHPYSKSNHQPRNPNFRNGPLRPMRANPTFSGDQITLRVTGINNLDKDTLTHFFYQFGNVTAVHYPPQSSNLAFVDYVSSTLVSIKTNHPSTIYFKDIPLFIEPMSHQSSSAAWVENSNPKPKFTSLKYSNTFIPEESVYYEAFSSSHEQNKNNSITKPATTSNAKQPEKISVIITNVPKELSAKDLQDAFATVGTVIKTDLLLNSEGIPTGKVAMTFNSYEAAQEAVQRYDGGTLNNQTIRVFIES